VSSFFLVLLLGDAQAQEQCWTDPVSGTLRCIVDGEIVDPGRPGGPGFGDDPGRRYVHTDVDPVIGDCHYWSDVPGGLDAWDPANDPAVIAVVTTLPLCPAVPGVDPEVRAWEVFRSWDLDPPDPTVTPDGVGITGLATQVATAPIPTISEDEVLPDGRLLEVRARIASLDVTWGDGTTSSHDPSEATGHPDGSVSHIYRLKTCTPEYRAEHPSGSLCHPSASSYTITVENVWVGEYRVGGAWTPLGTLSRSSEVPYRVDEVRGIPAP
jgi:hypothetical protein